MKKVAFFILVFALVTIMPIVGFAAGQKDIKLEVNQIFELGDGEYTGIVSSAPQIVEITKDGKLKANCVGFTEVVVALANGKQRTYNVVVRSGKDAPVFTSKQEAVNFIKTSANKLMPNASFKLKLANLPQDPEDREGYILKYLPDKTELDMPYTNKVNVYMLFESKGSEAIAEATCIFDYRTGANVARVYNGEKLALNVKEQQLKNKADQIIKELDLNNANLAISKKALLLHDYLILNGEYDTVASQNMDNPEYAVSYDAYGLLINGKGTCQAYSESYMLILNAVKISCKYETGMANGMLHSWNKVKFEDGDWHNVDVTFDDPTPDAKGRVSYEYFDITTSELAKTHKTK